MKRPVYKRPLFVLMLLVGTIGGFAMGSVFGLTLPVVTFLMIGGSLLGYSASSADHALQARSERKLLKRAKAQAK